MADGELSVGGRVACAEAGTAEALADDGACACDVIEGTVLKEFSVGGHGAGIDAHGEGAVAAASAPQDIGHCHDVVEGAAGAACHQALVYVDVAAADLGIQIHDSALDLLVGLFLVCMHDLCGILQKLADGHCIGRMHGQSDGGLNGGQVHIDAAVIPGHLCGIHLLIVLRTAVDGEVFFCLLVCDPYGGPAGGLCGHDVHAVSVFHGKICDAGAHKLHDFILYIAVGIGGTHQGQSHVVRAYAGTGCAGQIDGDHAGTGHVIGTAYQLLGQLAAAFAYGQGAQSAVSGMGVGAKDHFSAACHQLTVDGVDDCHIGGNIDAAVLVGCGQSKHVVIFVDGAAYRAQGVVAVGQNVGKGEFLHAGSPGCLNDADIGNVMAGHGIELHAKMIHVICCIVGSKDPVGHSALCCLGLVCCLSSKICDSGRLFFGNNLFTVHQIDAAVVKFNHAVPPC